MLLGTSALTVASPLAQTVVMAEEATGENTTTTGTAAAEKPKTETPTAEKPKVKKYTVKVISNTDKVKYDTVEVEENGKLKLPEAKISLEDGMYEYVGLYKDAEMKTPAYKQDLDQPVTKDMTFYARYNVFPSKKVYIETVNITVDANGNEIPEKTRSQRNYIDPGQSAKISYDGAGGYFEDREMTTPYLDWGASLYENRTVYLKKFNTSASRANTSSVTFVEAREGRVRRDDSGRNSNEDTIIVKNGSTLKQPHITDGPYNVEGYYTDEAMTQPFDWNTPITANTTVYVNYAKHDVTFYISANIDAVRTEPQKTVAYGTVIRQPEVKTPTGYTFDGFFADREMTQPYDWSKPLQKDTVVYAKYSSTEIPSTGEDKAQYDFIIKSNVEEAKFSSAKVTSGTSVKEPTVNAPEGFTFDGFFKDEAMTQPYTGWGKPITENTTVYAKFTKQEVAKYSFEIKANIDDVEFDKLEVNSGATVKKPTDTSAPKGYRFVGYFEDKEMTKEYDWSKPIKANTIVYAKFEKIEETNPSEPVKPTPTPEPEKPVVTPDPAKPVNPADPVKPVEPAKPDPKPTPTPEPSKPTPTPEPEKPVQPVEPAKPGEKPVEPKPVEPVKPVNPADPKPTPTPEPKPTPTPEPEKPVNPVDPIKPVDPVKPVDPTKPEPEKPVNPADPAKPSDDKIEGKKFTIKPNVEGHNDWIWTFLKDRKIVVNNGFQVDEKGYLLNIDGFKLVGIYSDPEMKTPANSEYILSEDLTLYAKYERLTAEDVKPSEDTNKPEDKKNQINPTETKSEAKKGTTSKNDAIPTGARTNIFGYALTAVAALATSLFVFKKRK
jgi:hypothetical protein